MADKRRSSKIGISVAIAALHVLLLNELLDASLDHLDVGLEARSRLCDHFGDEFIVSKLFARLHHSHDRRLQEHLAILENRLASLSVLLRGRLGHLCSRNFELDAFAIPQERKVSDREIIARRECK